MKFLVPVVLVAVAAVSAQDKNCAADYIVTNCLSSEQEKAKGCSAVDYDCLCAAYEAIATCYNNCPNDPRAPSARNQVTVYCQNASIHGTKAHGTKTSTSAMSQSVSNSASAATQSVTPINKPVTNAASSSSSSKPTSTNAAEALGGSVGGFWAVAGLAVLL